MPHLQADGRRAVAEPLKQLRWESPAMYGCVNGSAFVFARKRRLFVLVAASQRSASTDLELLGHLHCHHSLFLHVPLVVKLRHNTHSQSSARLLLFGGFSCLGAYRIPAIITLRNYH